GHYATGVMHQISKQTILMRGELNRITINADASRSRIKPHRTAGQLALGMTRSSPNERSNSRQHFFDMEWLRNV
ncbi:hypothetical protein, partial [Acinetobacter baumannii]|uniref:hypothetical protein n=1 Tax=Acinetobacter baumannii TaxID=470 RepID=UPI0027D1FD09